MSASKVLVELLWAEKYRPRSLSEIVNQVEVVERLRQFVKEMNMPHLLFAGPPGTGKTTAAHALAHDMYGEDYRMYMLELNASVSKSTPILVRINGKAKRLRFRDLDNLYFNRNREVLKVGDGEYVKTDDLEVLSIDRNGKVRWTRASRLIRHRAPYVVKLRIENGGVLELTGNHSIITIGDRGRLVERKASELKPGDYVLSFIARVSRDGVMGSNFPNEHCNSGVYEVLTSGAAQLVGHHLTMEVPNSDAVSSELLGLMQAPVNGELIVKARRIPEALFSVGVHTRETFLKSIAGSNTESDVARVTSSSKELLIDISWLARITGVESLMCDGEVKLLWNLDRRPGLLPAKPFIELVESAGKRVEGAGWGQALKHGLPREVMLKEELLEALKGFNGLKLRSDEEVLKHLTWLATSDLHVLKVVDVEVVEYGDYVYDISVPGTEMFFAGEVPVLLHNSDERGIDVIRTKVKEFARSRLPAKIPFKIVLLDEADNMTADAQQALRRLMEMYVDVTRFILIANYPSKIIEPIQSRCAVFRFTPLRKEDVISRLRWICKREGVKYEEEALEVIHEISEGDMRKAINILQSSAALGTITVSNVYKVVGLAHPKEIRDILRTALLGDFIKARDLLRNVMLSYGLSGVDIVKQMHKEIHSAEIKLPEQVKVEIADYLGEIQFRLVEGADDEIQLSALLAKLVLLGRGLRGKTSL